jgi:hypothetical protein
MLKLTELEGDNLRCCYAFFTVKIRVLSLS